MARHSLFFTLAAVAMIAFTGPTAAQEAGADQVVISFPSPENRTESALAAQAQHRFSLEPSYVILGGLDSFQLERSDELELRLSFSPTDDSEHFQVGQKIKGVDRAADGKPSPSHFYLGPRDLLPAIEVIGSVLLATWPEPPFPTENDTGMAVRAEEVARRLGLPAASPNEWLVEPYSTSGEFKRMIPYANHSQFGEGHLLFHCPECHVAIRLPIREAVDMNTAWAYFDENGMVAFKTTWWVDMDASEALSREEAAAHVKDAFAENHSVQGLDRFEVRLGEEGLVYKWSVELTPKSSGETGEGPAWYSITQDGVTGEILSVDAKRTANAAPGNRFDLPPIHWAVGAAAILPFLRLSGSRDVK